MKKELELTKNQEKVLEEFKAAVLKLRNADILPIENRYGNEILFINGKQIEEQWIGSDAEECPFETDQVLFAPCDLDKHNIRFDVLFANYFLPDEYMSIKLTK
jgi:hypothetical protein